MSVTEKTTDPEDRAMDNFDNVLVIDADGHVYEGNVDLSPRMPQKSRHKLVSGTKTFGENVTTRPL